MSAFYKDDTIRRLAAAEDQKKEIWNILDGCLDHHTLMGSDVLIAVMIEKEMSNGGLIMPSERLKESLYQSKVGMVVKTGPDAFRFRGEFPWVQPVKDESEEDYKKRLAFYTPSVGDWVIHWPTDSKLIGFNGVPCRYIVDAAVKLKTTKPESVL